MARESKDTTRDKIITAAERLFWHHGIKKVTVDEIAVAAEIGKGTVYLHFESKEEIGIAIISRYKQDVLEQQIALAKDTTVPILERLKRVITLPIAAAHERANKSPMVVELIDAVSPQVRGRFMEMIDREIDAIAGILTEGNSTGVTHVEHPLSAAREIKMISLVYMPGSIVCRVIDDPVRSANNTVEFIYQGLK